MYQEKGFKTIFDDVKAKPILKANIKEDEVIKPTKSFSVNNDKFDYSLIVDEYKIPSFKYIDDNSINDFYDYPDVTMSQNPEYKYKYPKLSTAETIKQQWQTEEGTPNELNRFLRHNEKGDSLEDIQEQDDVYQQGLKQIENLINYKHNKVYKEIEDYDDEINNDKEMGKAERDMNKVMIKTAKEDVDDKKKLDEKFIKRYKKSNPVLIKPVITPAQVREKVIGKVKTELGTDKLTQEQYREVADAEAYKIQTAVRERQAKVQAKKQAIQEEKATKIQNFFRGRQAKAQALQAKVDEKKEELDYKRKARYENLNKQYNNESKKIVSQEKLVLKGYDDVLNQLQNITSKKLTVGDRKAINKMLNDIDGSNIGAITLKQTAINRLLTKKELIESKKNEINAKRKAEAVERKAPRRVSTNLNIMDLSKLPANDDDSNYSVKKVIKT